MGTSVIVPTSSGLLHLGQRCSMGLQLSIENFVNWEEAIGWCRRNGVRAALEVEGDMLQVRQCVFLKGLRRDEKQTVEQLRSRLAAEGGWRLRAAPRPGLPEFSLAMAKALLIQLEKRGFAQVERPEQAVSSWLARRSDTGQALIDRFWPEAPPAPKPS